MRPRGNSRWDLMCRSPRGPGEQTLRRKFSILGGFLALPTETNCTTPHYYPKYEVGAIEFFLWKDPFKIHRLFLTVCPQFHYQVNEALFENVFKKKLLLAAYGFSF